ncbi:hypothetical protein P167DRAFT_551717 [Morchella conica CCBAS932]|uniref:Uncharacterized protein n=1 Tax=Morchella conica CCBAS932 TaxID=1392247 RepID=A0A3N4L074_9PEZI|nr:hypothetical protein P167DRAFT_551717 [Morchella conica CCBAS932]
MANKNLQPYKPVDVSFLGEQKLDDVSYWRNNVVAASKRHNYLFIAVRSTIRVYAPKYPYQTIPTTTPYTTLTSAASPTAAGFIDPQDPHAINSLTVGELGFEEVLVSAHDDGDVCAWYTRDLRRIAFRLSVGKSAWGVALHKERRLLAVSANTHQISVFELAIGRNLEEGERDDEDEYMEGEEKSVLGDEDCGRSHNGGRKRRRRRRAESRSPDDSDVSEDDSICAGCKRRRGKKSPLKDKTVKTLIGHGHNIPNISFLGDPSGRWLVGTSIDGTVILWDVTTERAVEKCKMGFHSMGWSVLFLKPQAFKPVSNIYEALGKPIPSQVGREPRKNTIHGIQTLPTDYYDPPTNPRFHEARAWDISPHTAHQSTSRILMPDERSDDYDDYLDEEEGDDESHQSSEDVDGHEVQVFIVPGGGHVELLTEEGSETDTSASTTATDSQEETAETYHSVPASVVGTTDVGSGLEDDGEQRDNILDTIGPVRVVEFVQDSEGEGDKSYEKHTMEIEMMSMMTQMRTKGRRSLCRFPPVSFIFSTTERNCQLLTLTPYLTPNVVCFFPLHQQNQPPTVQYFSDIDRLNMVHCIPDLSLVIAASQKGRAAIFRLTRVGDIFGMRLDTILPREDEVNERGRERRPSVLLGVAVSPVQERRRGRGGGLGVWGRKRWRLMMVYVDGSINSYELGREEGIVEVGGIRGGLDGLGGFVMI